MTATVEIQAVSHQFGEFKALSNINLSIKAGRFAVLLGPSGCGKTTLLSVLGGFINPTEGQVLLNGEDVTHVPPALRPTTTMFQDYALFPHMSLQNNVGFGLRMRGDSKRKRNKRARELLQLVGLEASWRKKPHELSGGQRQRVALARALAVDPDVLLLDEPLGALDLKLRRQMQDELKAIQKRVGTTFVHVTHDQEEAMAIADEIIVMNSGQVEDVGSPESIYLTPKTLFSAAFMGESNTVYGTVEHIDDTTLSVKTALGSLELPATANHTDSVHVGADVGVCFRPEHVRQGADPQPLLDLGTATLTDHAFFGTHQRCQLRAADGSTVIANLPQSVNLREGESLSLLVHKPSVVVLPTN